MKSFKDHINEITKPEAVELLELPQDYGKSDVKKAFRLASNLHHPDKGGDVEMMKKVNQAYDLLKNTDGTPEWNREESVKMWQAKAKFVGNDIANKFNVQNFLDYFEKQLGKKFEYTIKVFDGSDARKNESPAFAGIKVRFHTKDNKIAFDFDAMVYLFTMDGGKVSLSNSPTLSYSIGVTAFGYANRKKQKMAQRDWDNKNDHIILTKPEKTFSPAKMKKINDASGNAKMKRADFLLALPTGDRRVFWPLPLSLFV